MIKKLVFAALSALMFAGCEELNNDYPIVDWYPVEVYIYASDDNGNSIVQPDMPGMSLTFQGETYTVKDWTEYKRWQDSIRLTRAYMAVMRGFLAQKYILEDDSTSCGYRLYFGEIDGAADMDEDITLNWPDGTSDVIHYHCSDHKEGKNPSCNRSWKLNGKKHDGGVFYFTGKSLK